MIMKRFWRITSGRRRSGHRYADRVAIQTPDQRVRVFVSSTMQELAPERRAVREAIERLRLTPVMFELGARPHPPRALYRAYLEQSDVFVGLYWESYGWVPPGEELSGLEDEYRLSGDRPKLIYVKTPASGRQPRLGELIARIQRDDSASYRPFGSADDLGTLVADDLAVLLTERFAASTAMPVEPPRSRIAPLPRPATRLIGRDQDVTRVLDLLGDPDVRMVTIVGPGGVGKSRLALAVGDGARERYPDGVVYIDLAPLTEPSLVIPTLAKSLGVEEQTGTSVGARLRDRLAEARMLIVLDNMEQLAEAAGDVSDLLAATDVLVLLVTSRRFLDVRGERVYTLGPLPIPTAEQAVTAAVEMFLERARSIHPRYQPSDADLAAFGELSRRLDGLPLAIELAAAWLRVLSPGALLQRMGYQRLEFLREGARDLPARQRTLRDTIAWSHSLLSADARVLFARLAVFVGSADLEAIEQVTNSEGRLDTLDVIAELVDQSLVQALGEAAEPRFGMLETIREFAVERLEESGTADDYRTGHQAHYLELAERGNAALGTAAQVEWLDRLGRENDNFRAVLRRALRRQDAASALRMGRALASYWYISGSYGEGRGWMEQVAGLTTAQPYERAAARTIAAIDAFIQGDFGPIETGLDEALRIAAEGGDRRTVAFAQLLQALARGSRSDDQQWQDAVTEASRRLEAEGEPLALGFGLVAAALLARMHGRMDEARRLAQQAHDLTVQIGESFVRGYASTQLARACLGLGDVKAARNAAVEALLVARRLPNVVAMSYALELWATAELRDDRVERAGQLYALADRGYRQAGYRLWRTDAEEHRQLDTELRAALGDGMNRCSPRHEPQTWIGPSANSSRPSRRPSGCLTPVVGHRQPRD
jgi:predicted ATPase